ncbi:MAG: rhomboid family intramembrane serine protease [Planctomycetes bacterium]|nr:rhomboid family intramembrane serine protease [Planctomycetota bacterium]
MLCPDCHEPLARTRHPGDVQWACTRCGSRMATRAALELRLDAEALAAWHVGRKQGVVARRRCPSCYRPFLRFPLQLRERRFELDECERCRVAWFDRGEFERLPVDVAIAYEERAAERASALAPLRTIERVALQIGLPLLPDEEFVAARANVTVALAASSLLAPLLAALFPEVRGWLLAPTVAPWRELFDLPSLLPPTSLLEGLLLFWFLLLFGSALEQRIGSLRFGLLLIAANGIGRAWQAAMQPAGSALAPGFAAAVSGLLAALAVVAPWARLLLLPSGVDHWRWFVKLPVEAVLLVGERVVEFVRSFFSHLDDSFDGPSAAADGSDERAREPWRLTALFALPIAWASLLVLLALDDFGWPELAARPAAPWLHVGGALVGLLFGLHFRVRQAQRSSP